MTVESFATLFVFITLKIKGYECKIIVALNLLLVIQFSLVNERDEPTCHDSRI